MICVFPKDATNYTTNGLASLCPSKCEVREKLNGEYLLEMIHPLDEAGKWKHLKVGNIIKAPVPKMPTPMHSFDSTDDVPSAVYVCTVGAVEKRCRMHASPGIHNGACVDYVYDGEEVISLAQEWVTVPGDDVYARVISPRGITGWVRIELHFRWVRDLGDDSHETDDYVSGKQVREQPFRIYRIVQEFGSVAVYAKHIFYDLLDNMILSYKPEKTDWGRTVAKGILSNTLSENSFLVYSNIESPLPDVAFEEMNPADAFLNEKTGFCALYHAEMLRDWYDIYLVERIGGESSLTIAEGKNLKSITYDEDITETATRIIPTGEDGNGKIHLPETYIESPNAGDYAHPKYLILPVEEAKVGDGVTLEQAYEKMREAVQKEFDREADKPIKTVTVGYIDLTGTEEYKSLGLSHNVFLGDHVHVKAKSIDREITLRMTMYVFDCLLERYKEITLGTPYEID